MFNILIDRLGKVDNIYKQMGSFSREIETIKKARGKAINKKKQMLAEIKNSFKRLMNTVYTAEERLGDLENITREIIQTETQKKTKRVKKKLRTHKSCVTILKKKV